MHPKLERLKAKYELVVAQQEQELKATTKLKQDLLDAEEAQRLIQVVAEVLQVEAHQRVAAIVSRCLKAVFGEVAYEFKINFIKRRGKTEADLILLRDGMELSPLDETGGGVCDVVSFALRLAALVLTQPQKRLALILDEPFRNLSLVYRSRAAELLDVLAEEMKVQLVLVSHHPEFQEVGKVVEL